MTDLLNTAVSYHQAGRLDSAEELYRQILAEQPEQADVLHLLGVLAHQRGNHEQAIVLIERAIGINPTAVPYYTNLTEVYREAGDLGRAADRGRDAIRLSPSSTEAYTNLALVLRQADRPTDAAAVYREGILRCADAAPLFLGLGQLLMDLGRAVEAVPALEEAARLRPDHGPVRLAFADALFAAGRNDEAKTNYAESIRLAPASAESHRKLGSILHSEGQTEAALRHFAEAARLAPDDPAVRCQAATVLYERDVPASIAAYREIVRRFPEYPEAHNGLGYLLQDTGDVQGALAAYTSAVRLRPQYADAHLNFGLLLSEMGETTAAIAAFREALTHDPNHAEALAGLSMSLRDRLPAGELAACERVEAMREIHDRRRAVLRYGMAQVMDGRGDYDRAAELAGQANAYYRESYRLTGRAFDSGEHRAQVDQTIRVYSRDYFSRVQGWGLTSELPVFVLGLPRSGTSLIEQILASHPSVHGAGELNFVRDSFESIPSRLGLPGRPIESVGELDQGYVRAMAEGHLNRLKALDPNAVRVVDKMPDNYLLLGLIATLFPSARIIHARRDVRDVGLSCWLTHFRHISWANDTGDIAARIEEYRRIMAHWARVLPVAVLDVDYESAVVDLEGTARRLFSFCDLEWDAAYLNFHKTPRVVRTASMNQVREPVHTRSVGRWQHYAKYLGPILKLETD